MLRLKTRPQFQATMAGGTVSRTPHFALHRLVLPSTGTPAGASAVAHREDAPAPQPPQAVPAAAFAVGAPPALAEAVPVAGQAPADAPRRAPAPLFAAAGPWMGAVVPKRWAKRAVTRNAIKRQIYSVSADFEPRLPVASHVVRLRAGFDRKVFVSAISEPLKQAVRAELQQLFARACKAEGAR